MNTKTLSRRSFLKVVSAASVAGLMLAACQTAAPAAPAAQPAAPAAPAIPVVDIMASEYAFALPQKVPAGLVTINFMNHGKELHFASIVRLSKDIALEEILKHLDSPTPPDFLDMTQGVDLGLISPGQAEQVTARLVPGKYFVACWIPAPDHTPHAMKGMTGIFEVVENKSATQPAEPNADVAMTLKKDSVELPKEMKAGKQTWKIVNNTGVADATNGITIVQLANGKTLADAKKSFETADFSAIVQAAGGAGSVGTAWLTIDLKPGTYDVDTNVPDPKAPPPAKDQQPKTIAIQFTVK